MNKPLKNRMLNIAAAIAITSTLIAPTIGFSQGVMGSQTETAKMGMSATQNMMTDDQQTNMPNTMSKQSGTGYLGTTPGMMGGQQGNQGMMGSPGMMGGQQGNPGMMGGQQGNPGMMGGQQGNPGMGMMGNRGMMNGQQGNPGMGMMGNRGMMNGQQGNPGMGMMGNRGMMGGQQGNPGMGMMGNRGMMNCQQGNSGMGMMNYHGFSQQKQDYLKDSLHLSTDQEMAWNTFQISLTALQETRQSVHGAMMSGGMGHSFEKMEKQIPLIEQILAAKKTTLKTYNALLASLDDKQKTIFKMVLGGL